MMLTLCVSVRACVRVCVKIRFHVAQTGPEFTL